MENLILTKIRKVENKNSKKIINVQDKSSKIIKD